MKWHMKHASETTPPADSMNLLWGASAIAAFIGKTERATFHLLERGYLPGARKLGNQWVISKDALRALFEPALPPS